MSAGRILVVDDEPHIRRALRIALIGHGYEVEIAEDGDDALIRLGAWLPDAMVLDLITPKRDGFAVVRDVRTWSSLPIIVLSARGRESDKVAALDLGADDYITQPFGIDELLARLRMVLVDPHRHWADVLRSAWRLASGLHGELLALVLAPDGNVELIADQDREEMKRQLLFADDLGARTRVMSERSGETNDRIDAIVRMIRQERITVCVLGTHSGNPRGWFGRRRLDGLELAEAVLIQTDGVDVHLVRMRDRA